MARMSEQEDISQDATGTSASSLLGSKVAGDVLVDEQVSVREGVKDDGGDKNSEIKGGTTEPDAKVSHYARGAPLKSAQEAAARSPEEPAPALPPRIGVSRLLPSLQRPVARAVKRGRVMAPSGVNLVTRPFASVAASEKSGVRADPPTSAATSGDDVDDHKKRAHNGGDHVDCAGVAKRSEAICASSSLSSSSSSSSASSSSSSSFSSFSSSSPKTGEAPPTASVKEKVRKGEVTEQVGNGKGEEDKGTAMLDRSRKEDGVGLDAWEVMTHRRFLSAIFDIGTRLAKPKKILAKMRAQCALSSADFTLTSEHIKSHLQKYRLDSLVDRQRFLNTYSSRLGLPSPAPTKKLAQILAKRQESKNKRKRDSPVFRRFADCESFRDRKREKRDKKVN